MSIGYNSYRELRKAKLCSWLWVIVLIYNLIPNSMKHLSLCCAVLFLITANFKAFSQDNITYSYDNAGNRISREVIQLKSGLMNKSGDSNKPIEDHTFKNQIVRIYPNPTRGLLEVEIMDETNDVETINLQVYDSGGRLIIDKLQEPNKSVLDLSAYPNGLYILHIKRGQIISKWKIIKQ